MTTNLKTKNQPKINTTLLPLLASFTLRQNFEMQQNVHSWLFRESVTRDFAFMGSKNNKL